VVGGEDVWLVANSDVALKLALAFSSNYERMAAVDSVLQKARHVAGVSEPLTMSIGVAFAKAGYPANAMVEAAEALLRSAKKLRKGHLDKQPRVNGCIDWHWIESSVVETIEEARERGWSYADHGRMVRLTSRPWTIEEARCMQQAAREFRQVARRKREQLDEILRRGIKLSRLGWQSWWQGLNEGEKRLVKDDVAEKLPPRLQPPNDSSRPGVWREAGADILTPYIDLAILAEMTSNDAATNGAAIVDPEANDAQA
jgi:hypothetical protein